MSRGNLSARMMNDAQRLSNVGDPVDPSKQYDEISNGQEQVTIETLMRQAGVTAEDIQIVANTHPELISQIGGGRTCTALAEEATSRGYTSTGRCAGGTTSIYVANPDTAQVVNDHRFSEARQEYARPYSSFKRNSKGAVDPGGDSFYRGLEGVGFVSVDVSNIAYRKKRPGPEDTQMNSYLRTVQPGVTISFDCYTDERNCQAANTPGGRWGHVAVKRKDGNFQCDFTQKEFNCARYGPQIHISFPKDALVPKEYALAILQQTQQRMSDQNYQYPVDVRRRTVAKSSTAQRGNTATQKTRVASQRKTITPKKRATVQRNTSAKMNYARKVASQKKGRV